MGLEGADVEETPKWTADPGCDVGAAVGPGHGNCEGGTRSMGDEAECKFGSMAH